MDECIRNLRDGNEAEFRPTLVSYSEKCDQIGQFLSIWETFRAILGVTFGQSCSNKWKAEEATYLATYFSNFRTNWATSGSKIRSHWPSEKCSEFFSKHFWNFLFSKFESFFLYNSESLWDVNSALCSVTRLAVFFHFGYIWMPLVPKNSAKIS